VPLEPLFAGDAAKMICFTIESDFELGCFFVQNHAANGIFRQFLGLNLNEECDFCLLLIVVKKRKVGGTK
jgi:hypothetical protein